MGGHGSTIGGLAGGIGGAYFGPVGSMLGSTAGSAIGGMFDKKSNRPQQTAQQVTAFDPYSHFGGQLGVIEPALARSLQGGRAGQISMPGAVGNLFVAPGQQQTGALNQLEQFMQQSTPAFGAGLRGVEETVAGKYLDPTQQAPFQRLSEARQNIAKDLYDQAVGNIASSGVARGSPYSSSARVAQTAREGGRLSNLAAQDIAQAGWGQYGAERGLQDAAMRQALGIAPGLAGAVFKGGEELRSAEQAAGTAQAELNLRGQIAAMEGQLRAMGLDQDAITNVLRYMSLRALTPVSPILGPSQSQVAGQQMAGLAPLLQGMGMGQEGGTGGGGLGSLLSIFGTKQIGQGPPLGGGLMG